MSRRRVVITGLGAVTPLGLGVEAAWDGLIRGQSGVSRIQGFDPTEHRTQIAGECRHYDALAHFPKVEAKKIDRYTQFALTAAEEAIRDSGFLDAKFDPQRVGAALGTGIGGINELESQDHVMLERGPGRVSPFFIPKMMPNAMSGMIGIRFGFQGTAFVTSSACASSSHALGMALRTIQYGEADAMVSGGSEASITPLAIAGFSALKALSRRNDDPEGASRPFDRDRDGFVMGEGAVVMLLEELEHARARDARIYAELVGFGSTADAFHMTAPKEDGTGPARAMQQALDDARLAPGDVQYINAHGTSTAYNDEIETRAIKMVFGDHAHRLAVSSSKSMVGHLLGAAGALGGMAAVLSVARGVVHPTRNLEHPDPECDLDYVPGEARELRVDAAIGNALGFGGHNACLAFRTIDR